MPSVIDGTDNFSTDTDLVALTGADLTAVGIVGTNPYASLCKRDGSIVGGSDNGTFTKWANGNVETRSRVEVNSASVPATGNIGWYYPIAHYGPPTITATSSIATSTSAVAAIYEVPIAGRTSTVGIIRGVHSGAIAFTGAGYYADIHTNGRWK